jgi:hypothetical protein
MNRGRVGEGRRGKETDGCPLTIPLNVAQESHALCLITMVVDNREEVEGIIDPV